MIRDIENIDHGGTKCLTISEAITCMEIPVRTKMAAFVRYTDCSGYNVLLVIHTQINLRPNTQYSSTQQRANRPFSNYFCVKGLHRI